MNYLPSAIGAESTLLELAKTAKDTPEGCFVEVGVYKGGSASYLTELAEQQSRKIFLYDTFEGMPFQGEYDGHAVGEFSDTSFDAVKSALPYAIVTQGIFPDSAIEMPKIAFAHIDVDQYKSYIDCINYLSPLMVSGGIMWFDDYELEGARRAVDELIGVDKIISASSGYGRKYYIFP
jgi:O-methyltransferase